MATTSLDDYKLRCELLGHSLDVRGVCEGDNFLISGSRDKTVKIWNKDGQGYREEVTLKDHSNYVSCVFYLAPENWICSGSNDSTVQVYRSGELKPLLTLKGHTSTVSCISAGLEARSLVTGSWDGTARIWTIGFDNHVASVVELKGHEAAVWSVCSILGEKYVTGSADKNIFIWNKAGEKVRVLKGHSDCVRSLLGLANGFLVSASNDASIKVWNDMGECVNDFYGHENYIYSISLVAPNVIVSGSEDSTIRLWDLEKGQIGAPIVVPTQSVWSVWGLRNGDVAAGSSDGVLRVFTANPLGFASPDVLAVFKSSVDAFSNEKSKELGGIKVNDLPGPESLLVEGTEEGQTRIVRERNGKVMCYQWSNGTWNLVGDVTGASGGDQQTSGKTLYEGQEYDYVFSVDVEDGKPAIKLPYNNGDDPYLEAQKFIHKNDLPQAYLDQVANFIITNSKNAPVSNGAASQGYLDPFTGASRYVPGGAAPSASNNSLPSGVNFDPFTGGSSYSSSKTAPSRYFPMKEFLFFEVGDLAKILQKIKEFNSNKLGEDQMPVEVLEKFAGLAQGHASEENVHGLNLLMFWPDELFFPVLDVIRLSLLHETVCSRIANTELIEKLLVNLANTDRMPNQLMACRSFVNMFKHDLGRNMLSKYLNLVLTKLPLTATTNGNLQIALATLLLNLSIQNFSEVSVTILISRILTLFEWMTDYEGVFRLLSAVGNLVSLQQDAISQQFKNNAKFAEKLQRFKCEGVPENFLKVNDISSDLAGFLGL